MRTHFLASFSVGILLMLPAITLAEQIGNSNYLSWAKYKPGTSITLLLKTPIPGRDKTIDKKTVTKLISVDDDKVVVSMDGKEFTIPSEDSRKAPESVGEEDIKVGDKTYHCKIYQVKTAHIAMKVWKCPDVPGMIARQEMTSSLPSGDVTSVTTLESVDIK